MTAVRDGGGEHAGRRDRGGRGHAGGGVDGQVMAGEGRLVAYANFVKVAHTVFSLPFAFVGVATASRSHPLTLRVVLLVVAAFAAARFA